MVKHTSIAATNERLARRVRREGKSDPNSPFANRFVGIASGQIVVIADSLNDVSKRLSKFETDASKCYIVDVAADYDRVYEI